jgi:hypothetical protein
MGELDSNDTLPYDDAFDECERKIIIEAFDTVPVKDGTETASAILLDRFEISKNAYELMGLPAQFVVYEGLGHSLNEKVVADLINFFKNNM